MTTREYETEVRHMTPPITADDHAAAVDVAEQRMFEACVRHSCLWCNYASRAVPSVPVFVKTRPDRDDLADLGAFYHVKANSEQYLCMASGIRLAFPERSARLSSPRAVGE